MSSAARELADLLDEVSDLPGWRVEKIDASRWRVYPPKPADIIHISASTDPHALRNARALLRRAGFRDREDAKMQSKSNTVAIGAASISVPPPAPSPMDQIRADVDSMLGCLTRISDNLKLLDKEREGIQQLKTLLGSVLK